MNHLPETVMQRPLATISLDLDNQWAYMKTHGDNGWKALPSYLGSFVPRLLDLLQQLSLKVTVFVVGRDAAVGKSDSVLRMIADQGHELANHSFNHDPYFHCYSEDEIRREVSQAEVQIARLTGKKPVGFRGPGFTWSNGLLKVLAERGYLYDATSFPTFLGPLARAFYFKGSKLTSQEKQRLRGLYGGVLDGTRPIKPYCWRLADGKELLEIPVSTMPVLRLPFHMTYLTYLASRSPRLARLYLKAVVRMCRWTDVAPSFLLHPLDFIGGDQQPELSYFPAMNLKTLHKTRLAKDALQLLAESFQLVPIEAYARSLLTAGGLPTRLPNRKGAV